MPETSIKNFAVFGGGRWARILIQVLRSLLPEDVRILWVSRHLFESCEDWLSQNVILNLCLVREINLVQAAVDGVIVATSPETHVPLVRSAIRLRIPTLCEKPLATNLTQITELLELSRSFNCLAGLHLEFLYAGYLHNLAEMLRSEPIHTVHLAWQDPWFEVRDSEAKYGEFYTDLMNDQLPHCWSVLSVIRPKEVGLQITEVRETSEGAEVIGRFGSIAIVCSLGRRASQRIRRVTINKGDWALDFTKEPGNLVRGNLTTSDTWSGDRPVSRSLSSFIEAIRNPDLQKTWPMAIKNCLDAIQSSLTASIMWRNLLDRRIQELQLRAKTDLKNPEHIRLIIDRFLPEFSKQGIRFPVRTSEEQVEFARAWISRSR